MPRTTLALTSFVSGELGANIQPNIFPIAPSSCFLSSEMILVFLTVVQPDNNSVMIIPMNKPLANEIHNELY